VQLAVTQTLVGVLTEAEAEAEPRLPAVVFLNAGMLHRVGPNRLYVRIARTLAHRGFTSLRFDRSGVGDSPPRTDGLSVRAAALSDVREALDFVAARRSASSFILVGLCSGADLAVQAAIADERVVGAVLIDAFPYQTLRSRIHLHAAWFTRRGNWRRLFALDGPVWRRLRHPRLRATQVSAEKRRDVPPRHETEAHLREFTRRGMHLLIIYTADRDYSYRRHFEDTFPTIRSDRMEVAYFPHANHTFTLRSNQDLLVGTIDRWITCFQ